MNSSLKTIVCAFVTLMATSSYALVQGRIDVVESQMSEQELVELSQELSKEENRPANQCVLEILKCKSAKQIVKVKEAEYMEYYALEAGLQDWKRVSKVCNTEGSYFEIIVNAQNRPGLNLYRMRNNSYIWTSKGSRFLIYSPLMDQAGMNQMISELRAISESKQIDMGAFQGHVSMQKVAVKSPGGDELVLTSIEDRLSERTQECLKYAKDKESFCEDTSFSIQLNWVYNHFISFGISEGMDGAKFDAGYTRIVSVESSKIEAIKDIRDIFQESDLLIALKQDWIIRNSNQWTRFSQAKTWEEFWSYRDKGYYGTISEFQSYSNRLNQQQVAKVRQCAQLAGQYTKSNYGFACVQSKNGPLVYMFNYYVYPMTFSTHFEIFKTDANSAFVRIPLMSDSTGSAFLQIALPKQGSHFFKSLK